MVRNYPDLKDEKNRLGLTFGLSVAVHLILAGFFAVAAGLNSPAMAPAKRFIVEIFTQKPSSEEEVLHESRRLAEKDHKAEKERAPIVPAGATMSHEIGHDSTPPSSLNLPEKKALNLKSSKSREEKPEKADLVSKQVKAVKTVVEKQQKVLSAPKMDIHPSYEDMNISSGSSSLTSEVPEGEVISLDTMAFSETGYFAQIRGKLDKNNFYPPAAKLAGLQGKVRLVFTIYRDGQLKKVRVVQPSGFPILDEAAMKTVKKAAPFGRIPESMGKTLNIEVTFEYALNYLYAR